VAGRWRGPAQAGDEAATRGCGGRPAEKRVQGRRDMEGGPSGAKIERKETPPRTDRGREGAERGLKGGGTEPDARRKARKRQRAAQAGGTKPAPPADAGARAEAGTTKKTAEGDRGWSSGLTTLDAARPRSP